MTNAAQLSKVGCWKTTEQEALLILGKATEKQISEIDNLSEVCAKKWSLSDLSLEGNTPHSRFYSCNSEQFGPALLKILSNDGLQIEAGGFEVLSSYPDGDAVRIFAHDHKCAVMEVLEGPRLLDLIDNGQADVALEEQLVLTDRLLAANVSVSGLKSLNFMLRNCLAMTADRIPEWATDVVLKAQNIVHDLLGSQDGWVVLHGDLHPRNIMKHEGTWRAIDARGIFGPAAFEYANAFINPWDRKDVIFKDGRMESLVETIDTRLGCGSKTVAGCAIANALYYAHVSFQFGQGRHPVKCIRKLLEFIY